MHAHAATQAVRTSEGVTGEDVNACPLGVYAVSKMTQVQTRHGCQRALPACCLATHATCDVRTCESLPCIAALTLLQVGVLFSSKPDGSIVPASAKLVAVTKTGLTGPPAVGSDSELAGCAAVGLRCHWLPGPGRHDPDQRGGAAAAQVSARGSVGCSCLIARML